MPVNDDQFSSRGEYFESLEDVPVNPSQEPTLGDLIHRRFNRRELLKGALGVVAVGTLARLSLGGAAEAASAASGKSSSAAASAFAFDEIPHGVDQTHHVAPGYSADILIRWGDPVLGGAPAFDPMAQSTAAQLGQFGYNNDFLGYFPIDGSAEHGLLGVNHEYTNEELMFPGLGDQYRAKFAGMTQDLTDIEMSSHGGSIVEIAVGLDEGVDLRDVDEAVAKRARHTWIHFRDDYRGNLRRRLGYANLDAVGAESVFIGRR